MIVRFASAALVLALAAGCGGRIDTTAYDLVDGATGGDTSVTDTATGPIDTGVVATDTAPVPLPAQGSVGSPCKSNSECSTGHCAGGRCTTTCTSAADCVSGWYCASTQNGRICRCFPSGQDCGGLDKNCDGIVSSYAPCSTPTPSDAGPQPPPYDAGGTLSCQTCAQNQCGTETQTCLNDNTCMQFLRCVQNCSVIPSTCVSDCANTNNDQAVQDFLNCMTTNCAGCQ